MNRVRQHELDTFNKRFNTALSSHALECNHNFDFNNPKILAKNCGNNRRRKYFENIFILKNKHLTVNFNDDYNNVLWCSGAVV